MPVKKIVIVRHGKRLDNESGEWTQQSATPYDTPLSDAGVEQVKDTARGISEWNHQSENEVYVHSSPFLRCVETADSIVQRTGGTIRLDSVFGEWLTPDYFTDYPPPPPDNHQSLVDKNQRQSPFVEREWRCTNFGNSGDYGESWEAMHDRFSLGMDKLLEFYNSFEANSTAIIVTHGAGCNALLGHLLNQPLLSRIHLASYSVLEKNHGDNWETLFNSNDAELSPPVLSSNSTSSSSVSEVFGGRPRHNSDNQSLYFVESQNPFTLGFSNNEPHCSSNNDSTVVDDGSTTTSHSSDKPEASFNLQFSEQHSTLPTLDSSLWKFGGNQF